MAAQTVEGFQNSPSKLAIEEEDNAPSSALKAVEGVFYLSEPKLSQAFEPPGQFPLFIREVSKACSLKHHSFMLAIQNLVVLQASSVEE